MNEQYREQRPLLCDDLSDDDLNTQNCSPRPNQRNRVIVNSGKVRNQMKGAAVILKSWPDHWCSTLKYWWIGLGMMAVVVLIVYNSVIVFSMLPIAYTKAVKSQTPYNIFENHSSHELLLPDIYMHVFADTQYEINLNDYLPYVKVISKRYPDCKFHFIIVINEIFKDLQEISDETKNTLALNSLWADVSYNNNQRIKDNNLFITYVSINKYLSNPLLQNISSNVSKELMEFFVRILSIWEKGGIAFNPIILTPRSPNNHYIEKIQNVLSRYKEFRHNKHLKTEKITEKFIKLPKTKKKFDNIRDIINALEEDERLYNISQQNLTETEDQTYSVSVDVPNRRGLFKNENVSTSRNNRTVYHHNNKQSDFKTEGKLYSPHTLIRESEQNLSTYEVNEINRTRNSTQSNLLPLFLELIFPKKTELSSMHKEYRKERAHNIRFEQNDNIPTVFKHIEQDQNNYKVEIDSVVNEDNAQLTIDLKGNIVASNIPCHALIGNILKDSVHHTDKETLSEFIIAELTVFCKGVLSSCKGIDVILL